MLTPLLATTLSLVPQVSSDTESGGRAFLNLGPLRGGEPIRIDLRTNRPLGNALLLFGLTPSPTPLQGLGIAAPAVHLPATGAPLTLPLDAGGRLNLSLPTIPGQFAGLEGLTFYLQAGVPQLDGSVAISALRGVRMEASEPPADFLVDAGAALLPAGAAGLGAGSMLVADLDGDGRDDLLFNAGGLGIWKGTASGAFATSTLSIPHPGDPVGALAAGDLDGDGDLDLIVGGGFDLSTAIPDRIYLNDGAGGFTAGALPQVQGIANGVVLFDVELDGDLDIAFARGGEPHLGVGGALDSLLINDGSANFTEDAAFAAAPWNVLLEDSTDITAADFDYDGDYDLLISRSDLSGIVGAIGAKNRLLTNNGGVFIDEAPLRLIPQFDDNTSSSRFVDIDGDGDLDIVSANSSLNVPTSASSEIYINQGGLQGGTPGFFLDDSGSPLEDVTDSGLKLGMAAGDLDADGDIDLAFAVHDLGSGSTQPIYLNQGGAQGGVEGEFEYASWFDPGDYIAGQIFFVDIDLDGDLDVVQAAGGDLTGQDPTSSDMKLYLNTHQ